MALTWWILLCVLCNSAGWLLSALHELNGGGYAVVFALAGLALLLSGRSSGEVPASRPDVRKLRRRFHRPLPLAFLILAALAFLGGALYPPANYDALAYREPRVLHWLAEGRWHWIPTLFQRLNTRAPGFEWMSAPLIAFTKTDRLLFLLNVIPFLLLPGLLYSALTRLGVRPRVAWHWMWLAPTGYCYLLQAGSIANDMFGAPFVLAALDYALRARKSGRVHEVWLSLLSAALMTSSKASNLLLMLPWLVAVAPSLKLLWRRLMPGLAVAAVAALASLLPTIALNLKHCGDWSGVRAENVDTLGGASALRLANNTVMLALWNVAPPVFPFANAWDQVVQRIQGPALRARLEQMFEPVAAHWTVSELQTEVDAGLGFGVTVLLLASCVGGWLSLGPGPPSPKPDWFSAAILCGVLIALGVFLATSFLSASGRALAPFYLALMPAALLGRGQVGVVGSRWWRWCASGVLLLAAFMLVLCPARPLWPASTLLNRLAANSRVVAMARATYAIVGSRSDALAPARALLPAGSSVAGLITFDDLETTLWRPFGGRRFEHVLPNDSAAELRARGIDCVLVNAPKLAGLFHRSLADWLREVHGEAAGTVAIRVNVNAEPTEWILVNLVPAKSDQPRAQVPLEPANGLSRNAAQR